VAGGGVPPPVIDRDSTIASSKTNSATIDQTLKATKALDLYLSMLASTTPVTLMPSGPPASVQSWEPPTHCLNTNGARLTKSTPLATPPPPLTNSLLPQVEGIHRSLLPLSYSFTSAGGEEGSFSGVGNPVGLKMEEEIWLGMSAGGILSDIRAVTAGNVGEKEDGKEDINVLKRQLKWGHLAPTAPAGVAVYPTTSEDPFVIDSNMVDVLFAGGSPGQGGGGVIKLANKERRVVSVPRFYERGEVVLVEIGGKQRMKSVFFDIEKSRI